MLREAQRESNWSSTKVSPISSAIMSLSSTGRNTPTITYVQAGFADLQAVFSTVPHATVHKKQDLLICMQFSAQFHLPHCVLKVFNRKLGS